MRDEGWQRLIRLLDEAFGDYLTGLVALRKRVVLGLKHKLAGSEVLGSLHPNESEPRERPAAGARRPRTRGRRKRRS